MATRNVALDKSLLSSEVKFSHHKIGMVGFPKNLYGTTILWFYI